MEEMSERLGLHKGNDLSILLLYLKYLKMGRHDAGTLAPGIDLWPFAWVAPAQAITYKHHHLITSLSATRLIQHQLHLLPLSNTPALIQTHHIYHFSIKMATRNLKHDNVPEEYICPSSLQSYTLAMGWFADICMIALSFSCFKMARRRSLRLPSPVSWMTLPCHW